MDRISHWADHGSMFVRIGTCHAVPCLFVLAPAILSQLTASCLPIFNEILIPFFCGVLTQSLVTNFVSYLLLPIFRENFCQFKLCYWIYVLVFLIFSPANNYLWGGCVRHDWAVSYSRYLFWLTGRSASLAVVAALLSRCSSSLCCLDNMTL